ncbi:LPXTG cell wall anchor domain-containing protein [Winkia neuii]
MKTNATELPATGSAAAMLLTISCALIGAGALAIRRQKGN